jgi:putative ABC transport system permease protein
MAEQGAWFGFLGLGVLLTFRFFRFPDLTAEGSYPLGGAVAASLLVAGLHPAMIQGLGVDTDRTKMIGLALSNGLIALSGALVAQDHGFADIGMGTGILVTGAAAVMIGEAIFGDGGILRWIAATLVGVLLYRLLVALALRVGFEPVDLKLVTAGLLLAALALPRLWGRR